MTTAALAAALMLGLCLLLDDCVALETPSAFRSIASTSSFCCLPPPSVPRRQWRHRRRAVGSLSASSSAEYGLSRPTAAPPPPPVSINAIENDNEAPTVTSATAPLSPLLLRASLHRLRPSDVASASTGLCVWSSALRRGRLPVDPDDFTDGDSGGGRGRVCCWPHPPALFRQFCRAMAELGLPRFVLRHPDAVDAVLLGMLRRVAEFHERVSTSGSSNECRDDDDDAEEEEAEEVETVNEDASAVDDHLDIDALAAELADSLSSEWSDAVEGVRCLDALFGADHGLLDVGGAAAQGIAAGAMATGDVLDNGGDSGGGRPREVRGFGHHDGVWSHSGWKYFPELQRKVASMPELRDLVSDLGRRPSAEGDKPRRFPPQRSHPEGLGVEDDPITRDSVKGLRRTGNLSEMLPSEAALLRGGRQSSSSSALRRLFLARMAESNLLGYELSGFVDATSVPRQRRNRRANPRLPAKPGGPLVVCLDTSHSMTGSREALSKAVVLACVAAAHEQHRPCRVVAFSSGRNAVECDNLTCDADGIQRLLVFLSNSFGGGTDVTGALRRAMDFFGEDGLAASDLLLVTDGEIPDPPVSETLLEALRRLQARTGMQVHGLLVGRDASAPLSKLCTEVHNFLVRYEEAWLMSSVQGLMKEETVRP